MSVTETATIATDGAYAVLERLAPRYWDLDDPRRAGDLAAMSREQWVRIVIHPQTVHRYAV